MTDARTRTDTSRRGALDERLRAIIARARWVSRGVRTGAAVWPVPASIAGALLTDAARPLPPIVRAGIAILIIALALRVVLGLVPSRGARRMTALRAARLAEDRAQITHNMLVNALQLRPLASAPDNTVQAELARRAVARGDARAAEMPVKGMVNTAPLKRAWAWSAAALGVFALFWIASPRLFAMGLPRLIEPWADHPPYTPTDFEVSWEPSVVLVGDAVTIRARLARTLPRGLDLIVLDARGNPLDRAPMTAQPDPAAGAGARPSEYTAMLRDLRAPFRFYVAGETGRSPVFAIVPEMRPRILSTELRIAPPAYTGLPEVAHTGVSLTRDRDAIPVLAGSTVTFRARTTAELQSVDQPGSDINAGASTSGRDAVQQVRFDALAEAGPRTLTLRPVALGGLVSHDTASVDILIVQDRPPSIMIDLPARGGEVFVLEGAAFPVRAVATDDVALARLTLRRTRTRAASADAPIEREFPIDPGDRRGADAQLTLTTADIDAAAGDTVALTFFATDNRPADFGGPQTTASDTIAVHVLSAPEFARRFAQELTARDIVRPYEQLARAADELDNRAQDLRAEARELARDLDRLAPGDALPEPLERSARALAGRLEQFARQRDALANEVRRRLEAPDAVEFDRQMREPLERMLERLESMQTPDAPDVDDEPSPEGGDSSRRGEAQENEGDRGPGAPGQALDRARVGRWLDEVEQSAEQNAQQAALASDEAQLDLVRPARALELADHLQRTLEQVDDAARRQRVLADRLAALTDADETARQELAASQESIQSQITRAIRYLRVLGDRAAHELASSDPPSALARAILDERAKVQQAIDDIAASTEQLGDGLGGASIRALVADSAELVMDVVYQQTLPVTDALSGLTSMPARDDEPGAQDLAPAIDAVRRALEILEQVERYLDEARDAYEQGKGGTIALRGVPEAIVVVALAASPDLAGSSSVDAEVVIALDEARLRIHRLRATLRQVELAMTPLLPKMGASAQSLAEGIVYSDAPDAMESAAWALRAGDLAAAAEHAREAAEALEALYQDPGQSQPGQSAPPDIDQEMQLRRPSDAQAQAGAGQSSPTSPQGQESSEADSQPADGHSTNNSPQSSMLDQLAQNRARQQSEQSQQADGDPRAQAGQSEGGRGNNSGARGEPSSPGDVAQEDEEGQRRRARFFNEMLYQESDLPPELVDGSITDALPGNQLNRAPGARSSGAGATSPAIPRGLTGPGAAAFIHVPDAYKDVVAAYFERVARESPPLRETP